MKLLITLYIIGGLISSIVCINYVQHKRRAKNDICRDCANLRMIYANGDHECNNRSFCYRIPPQICSLREPKETPSPSSLKVKTIRAEYPIPVSLMNSHDLLKAHLVERLAVDIIQYAKFETVHDPYAGDTLRATIKVVDPNA